MFDSALKIVASIFSWAAAKGVDVLLGRWVAEVVILYEKTIQKGVMDGFRKSMESIQKDAPQKYDGWKQWREKVKKP
jgi:hypothetical protein